MKVVKFGGSSLASAEQVRKVCDIVVCDAERKIVVVSAPGKRETADSKVTDLLIAAANARLGGQPAQHLHEVVAVKGVCRLLHARGRRSVELRGH